VYRSKPASGTGRIARFRTLPPCTPAVHTRRAHPLRTTAAALQAVRLAPASAVVHDETVGCDLGGRCAAKHADRSSRTCFGLGCAMRGPRRGNNSTMEIFVEITEQDLVDYAAFHQNRSPLYRRRRLSGSLSMLLLMAAMWFGSGWMLTLRAEFGLFDFLIATWPCGILMALMVGLTWRAYSKSAGDWIQQVLKEGQNRGLFGWTRIEISPEGLLAEKQLTSGFHKWLAVERIDVGPQAAYLYTAAHMAIIVPLRDFERPEAFDRFVQLARQYHRAANPVDAEIVPPAA
jgi:hypothetical protein